MNDTNYAENQTRWDAGDASLEDCHRKGQEHRAYGWAMIGLGFTASKLQRDAYETGYRGEPFRVMVAKESP